MKTLALVITVFMLLGCQNAPVRREKAIVQHPEWNAEMVTLIQNGYLAVGMDQEQVQAAWGKPCVTCTGTTKGDWGEAWEYATQVVFFDKAGKVTRWTAK